MNNPPSTPIAPPTRPRRPRSVSRALAYPYDVPNRSYVIHAGDVTPVESDQHLEDLAEGLENRTPVIACGSNQSPSALAWKFALAEDGPVPVVRIRLADFDTVYCAHFAGYGSVPATLHPSPGTMVTLFVNWLTDTQLAHMHTTETTRGNYVYGDLSNLNVDAEYGPAIDRAGAYVTTIGAFALDGRAVPLAEVEATGRPHPALRQRDLIQSLLDLHGLADTVETFVQRNIDDEDERERRQGLIRIGALPFQYSAFEPRG
ncbi:MAG: hypothetical protein CMM61_11995 [Rhodospirillaceae bacterium]|nr:hypothetical protein [Rhodospirillaceae bacterium]